MTLQETPTRKLTVADLEDLPYEEGTTYELIDGELHVSRTPHYGHQVTSMLFNRALLNWSERTGRGVAVPGLGVILAEDQAIAPDVFWFAERDRIGQVLDKAGHLTVAPELVVEVLSQGRANMERDLVRKLSVYSRYGVREYWIADWRERTIQIFRRVGDRLEPVAVLTDLDTLTSPLLAGFEAKVVELFPTIP